MKTRLMAKDKILFKLIIIITAISILFQNELYAISTPKNSTLAPSAQDPIALMKEYILREFDESSAQPQKAAFEEMISSSENLMRYINEGKISGLIPIWNELERLYENEKYRRKHPIRPGKRIEIIFKRLESNKLDDLNGFFKAMAKRERFSKADLLVVRRVLFLCNLCRALDLEETPEKSAVFAEKFLQKLGYSPEEIELDILLVKHSSLLRDLAIFGFSREVALSGPSRMTAADMLDGEIKIIREIGKNGKIHNLKLLRFIQFVNFAGAEQRMEERLTNGFRKRVDEIYGLAKGIIKTRGKRLKQYKKKYIAYEYSVFEQLQSFQKSLKRFESVLRDNRIDINNDILGEVVPLLLMLNLGKTDKNGHLSHAVHCFDTAITLIQELGVKDTDLIIAALLHDILDDMQIASTSLELKFNRRVYSIVSVLSRPCGREYNTSGGGNRYYLKSLVQGIGGISDPEILKQAQIIAIADCIATLKMLGARDRDSARDMVNNIYEMFVYYFVGKAPVSNEAKQTFIEALVNCGLATKLLSPVQIENLRTLSKSLVEPCVQQIEMEERTVPFIGELAMSFGSNFPDRPTVLTFGGVKRFGEPSLIDSVKADIESRGRKVVIINADDYAIPRVYRDKLCKEAREQGNSYYEQRDALYDFSGFKRDVLSPLGEFRKSDALKLRLKLTRYYDTKTGEFSRRARHFTIDRNTVVLIEGMHALQKEFLEVCDASFMFYMPVEMCLKDASEKETGYPRAVLDRFMSLDLPAYTNHWIEYWTASDFVIDITSRRKTVLENRVARGVLAGHSAFVHPKKRFEKSMEAFFQKLIDKKYIYFKGISSKKLTEYWKGEDEISVILDISVLKDDFLELAGSVTKLALNLLPGKKIHIIAAAGEGDMSDAEREAGRFYDMIGLGSEEAKRQRIKLTFEPRRSDTEQSFAERVKRKFVTECGIDEDNVIIIAGGDSPLLAMFGTVGDAVVIQRAFLDRNKDAATGVRRILIDWLIELDKRSTILDEFSEYSIKIVGGRFKYSVWKSRDTIYIGEGLIELFSSVEKQDGYVYMGYSDFGLYEICKLLVYEKYECDPRGKNIKNQLVEEVRALSYSIGMVADEANIGFAFDMEKDEVREVLCEGWRLINGRITRNEIPDFRNGCNLYMDDINALSFGNEDELTDNIVEILAKRDERLQGVREDVKRILSPYGDWILVAKAMNEKHEREAQESLKETNGKPIQVTSGFSIEGINSSFAGISKRAKRILIHNNATGRDICLFMVIFHGAKGGEIGIDKLLGFNTKELEMSYAVQIDIGDFRKSESYVVRRNNDGGGLSLYRVRGGNKVTDLVKTPRGQYILDLSKISGNTYLDRFFGRRGKGIEVRRLEAPREPERLAVPEVPAAPATSTVPAVQVVLGESEEPKEPEKPAALPVPEEPAPEVLLVPGAVVLDEIEALREVTASMQPEEPEQPASADSEDHTLTLDGVMAEISILMDLVGKYMISKMPEEARYAIEKHIITPEEIAALNKEQLKASIKEQMLRLEQLHKTLLNKDKWTHAYNIEICLNRIPAFILAELFREDVQGLVSYANEKIAESPFGVTHGREDVLAALVQIGPRAREGTLKDAMAWHVLQGLGAKNDSEGVVVYSLKALLESDIFDPKNPARMRDFIARTNGKVMFYGGDDYALPAGYEFIGGKIINIPQITERRKQKKFTVYMLDDEQRRAKGLHIQPVLLDGNQYLIPIAEKRDVQSDILLGMEVLRNKAQVRDMPSLFKLLLIEEVKKYFIGRGFPLDEEHTQRMLGMEIPRPYVGYSKDMEDSCEEMRRLITSA